MALLDYRSISSNAGYHGPMDFLHFFLPQIGGFLVLALLGKMIASKADSRREVRAENGRVEFAPNPRSFVGVYGFTAVIAYIVIAYAINGFHSIADLAVPSVALGFLLLLYMAFPATIVVDDSGLEQTYWLRRKRIAWKEIAKLDVIEKTGEVNITSKSGVKIMYTRQLPDRTRFLAEIDSHRGSKPVVETPDIAALRA